jgi:hypothetical protein
MKVRTGFIAHLWWRFMPGITIRVKWPRGNVTNTEYDIGRNGSIVNEVYTIESSDPNDHYRPFLEKNVGKQGIDWDWRIQVGNSMWTPGYEDQDIQSDKVVIKFRKGKEKWASITMIMWS